MHARERKVVSINGPHRWKHTLLAVRPQPPSLPSVSPPLLHSPFAYLAGQSPGCQFCSNSILGQTISVIGNPFASKPFGSQNDFGTQTGSSVFGTSAGTFEQPSTLAFGASTAPAFGASTAPAFGSFFLTENQMPTSNPRSNPFGNVFYGAQSGLMRGGLEAYGEKFFGSSSKFVQSNITQYFSNPQYYFEVNGQYVRNKLNVILFPFLHRGNCTRITEPVEGRLSYKSPINDVNAPDLYIPFMAFGTYLLLSSFYLGVFGR